MQQEPQTNEYQFEKKTKQQCPFDDAQNVEQTQSNTQKIVQKSITTTKTCPDQQSDQSNQINPAYQQKQTIGQGQEDKIQQFNLDQKIEEGEEFMLPQERELDINNPKYQFCRFISRHYRLIEDKKQRKNHFVRLQPVFARFLHVLKLRRIPPINIDAFRKYFKKFFKHRKMRYEETTNRVDMKVVVGIDRRYNSKFDF